MLVLVTEAWQEYKKLAWVSIDWLKKLNITGTIDNKGQNKNLIDGESKMKLKNWKITLVLWSRDVLRFGAYRYAVTKTLQEIEILARSVYEINFFSFRDDEPSEEW